MPRVRVALPKKNKPWAERLWFFFPLLFFIFIFGLFFWIGSWDWVPFGQDYTLIDGVLRVRSTYAAFPLILMICTGCWAIVQAFVGFAKLKAWTWNNYLAGVFLIFWLVIWFGFIPAASHAGCSLKRDAIRVEVTQGSDAFHRSTVYFDRACVVSAELYEPVGKLSYDVLVRLRHDFFCECKTSFFDDDSSWTQRISFSEYFLTVDRFPFDAGVFAYAIATGSIDLTKAGLKEGRFYALFP